MTGKADLHIHTNHSDGFYSPKEIILKAKEKSLDIISITDHDNLSGIKEAADAGKDVGIEVISGVEISSDIRDKEVHILAYFIEPGNEEVERYLTFFREERKKRALRILNKLRLIGIPISSDEIMEKADTYAIGRPHIDRKSVVSGPRGAPPP